MRGYRTAAATATVWLSRQLDHARRRGGERGDVPGWVMVTLMSAILVVAILVPFRDKVVPAIEHAIDSVTDAAG